MTRRTLVAAIATGTTAIILGTLGVSVFQDMLLPSPWFWLAETGLLALSLFALLAWRLDTIIRENVALAVAASTGDEEGDIDEPMLELLSMKTGSGKPREAQAPVPSPVPKPAPKPAAEPEPVPSPAAEPEPVPSPAPKPALAPVATPGAGTGSGPATREAAPFTSMPPPSRNIKAFKVSWKTVTLFIETYKEKGIGAFSLSKLRKDMGIDQHDEKKVRKIRDLLGRACLKDLVSKKGSKFVIIRARRGHQP